jgi:ABC-type uncharacterized transport system substrate-binding protein
MVDLKICSIIPKIRLEVVMRKIVFALIVSMLMLTASAAFAEEPVRNINPKKHPNLAAAQKMSQKAFEKITAAQQANEFDMDGHAQKAKELLEQVNHELKEAAEAANRHREHDRDGDRERNKEYR